MKIVFFGFSSTLEKLKQVKPSIILSKLSSDHYRLSLFHCIDVITLFQRPYKLLILLLLLLLSWAFAFRINALLWVRACASNWMQTHCACVLYARRNRWYIQYSMWVLSTLPSSFAQATTASKTMENSLPTASNPIHKHNMRNHLNKMPADGPTAMDASAVVDVTVNICHCVVLVKQMKQLFSAGIDADSCSRYHVCASACALRTRTIAFQYRLPDTEPNSHHYLHLVCAEINGSNFSVPDQFG